MSKREVAVGIDIGETIEYVSGLPWKGIVPLSEILRRFTDLPVILTNDADAAAVIGAGSLVWSKKES